MLLWTALALGAPPADRDFTLPTESGEVTFFAAGHGTVRIGVAGKTLWLDPWSKAELTGPKADVVLITDIHPDHLDPDGLNEVAPAGVIVAPKAVADALGDRRVDHVLANGETVKLGGITVEATPMYNNERGPEPGKLFHTKGRGNGYLLTIGGKRIYFAGDTECTTEMKALTDIDLAFVPMNLPYTMPPDEAASCVKAFAPREVIPYHYRGSDLGIFEAGLKGTEVKVHRLDFYPGGEK